MDFELSSVSGTEYEKSRESIGEEVDQNGGKAFLFSCSLTRLFRTALVTVANQRLKSPIPNFY